jgi:hypothetical protein
MSKPSIHIQLVAVAVSQRGSKASLREIYRGIETLVPDWPNTYKNRESFEGAVRAVIERHCPQSEKYEMGTEAFFERVDRGTYRVVPPAERVRVIERGLALAK